MHIVNVAFECAAFEPRLMRGGVSTLVWHLSREYARQGHRVSIITPAHGCIEYLREKYDLVQLDYRDHHVVPLVLDPEIWSDRDCEINLELVTEAFLLSVESVDIYFLSDSFLDLLPDRLYPDREFEGRDLAFFKPLVFQVDCIRFIDTVFRDESLAIQAYEPYYTYLLPAVLGPRQRHAVTTTIPVNVRIEERVFRPQLERILAAFQSDIDLSPFSDEQDDYHLSRAIVAFRQPKHNAQGQGERYICYFSLVAAYSTLIDFLSAGQRDYHSTFHDTPFEQLFNRLTVARVIEENAHKQFVGGCALPQWWLDMDPATVDRATVLRSMKLDPTRPTFFHAARFATSHKGQIELMRAIDEVLANDRDVNFIVRCATGAATTVSTTVGNEYMQEVADRYPRNVHLDWRMVEERILFDEAAAADFCIFPSKNETDAFLIVQGEAMACGAVPIATAQVVTRHFNHHLPLSHPHATGFSVRRSFRRDDTRLTVDLARRIREALLVFRDEPTTYRRLSANCRRLARTFVWERCAKRRIDVIQSAIHGTQRRHSPEAAIRYGWFERLSEHDWQNHRRQILHRAAELGDIDVYGKCAKVGKEVVQRLFAAASARADFERCRRVAAHGTAFMNEALHQRCRTYLHHEGLRVEYYPIAGTVEQVDIFYFDRVSCDDTPSPRQRTIGMQRRDSAFEANLPIWLEGQHLTLMLTLDTGRVTWDCIRPIQSSAEESAQSLTSRGSPVIRAADDTSAP